MNAHEFNGMLRRLSDAGPDSGYCLVAGDHLPPDREIEWPKHPVEMYYDKRTNNTLVIYPRSRTWPPKDSSASDEAEFLRNDKHYVRLR